MTDHSNAIATTDFNFPGQIKVYNGKVRDVYFVKDKLVMVASDRISAFDHILPRAIPYKGQVLNQVASYFLNATRDIVPNWLEATPDANVAVGRQSGRIRNPHQSGVRTEGGRAPADAGAAIAGGASPRVDFAACEAGTDSPGRTGPCH